MSWKACFESWDRARNTDRKGRDGATIMEYDGVRQWEVPAATEAEAQQRAREEFAKRPSDPNIGCIIRDPQGAGQIFRPAE